MASLATYLTIHYKWSGRPFLHIWTNIWNLSSGTTEVENNWLLYSITCKSNFTSLLACQCFFVSNGYIYDSITADLISHKHRVSGYSISTPLQPPISPTPVSKVPLVLGHLRNVLFMILPQFNFHIMLLYITLGCQKLISNYTNVYHKKI